MRCVWRGGSRRDRDQRFDRVTIEDLSHHQEPHVTVAELAEYFRVSEKTIEGAM